MIAGQHFSISAGQQADKLTGWLATLERLFWQKYNALQVKNTGINVYAFL
jgi:hypothetical protein